VQRRNRLEKETQKGEEKEEKTIEQNMIIRKGNR